MKILLGCLNANGLGGSELYHYELAKELYDKGFDVPGYSSRTKNGSTSTFFHKGKKYFINKKDMNHGTKSFLCTIELEDETILKLKKSSDKLKEVLSVL